MPEAEDVITDAARHATVFMQALWRRHRGSAEAALDIAAVLQRLDLLLTASFSRSFRLRLAQAPAPTPFLRRWFLREEFPATATSIPATDGEAIWLPVDRQTVASGHLTVMAFQQAARAAHSAAHQLASIDDPLSRAIFEVLQADRADAAVAKAFPGLKRAIESLRTESLRSRPKLDAFPPSRRPLESWLREVLQQPATASNCEVDLTNKAHAVAQQLRTRSTQSKPSARLFRDHWLGELREITSTVRETQQRSAKEAVDDKTTVRSARMSRRPDVRAPDPRDEATSQGAWMVQTAQPHEHAEDPFGMQRPTDRDEQQAAEEFADSLSELSEARLVSVPGAPKEILLSDDPPDAHARMSVEPGDHVGDTLHYPEWDYRSRSYREPGATVRVLPPVSGPKIWVEQTLDAHRSLLQSLRRQFESLRAQRVDLRQQFDGDEIDIEACVDAQADHRARAATDRGLYRRTHPARRELAVMLLIDVSGSTDGWISQHRRVIDVEREALLLVTFALDALREPYAVMSFSGESIHSVNVRTLKSFTESIGPDVGLRIAGLEPEKYTRVGAALRHASALLMRERARHRLLILLSDGKPNDVDEYDGRYGVEDLRQASVEARLQGISCFCLTIDRQAANYLPLVFGEHHYAVLQRPESLPTALLRWVQRLITS